MAPGLSVRDLADQRGVAVVTIRTHLAHSHFHGIAMPAHGRVARELTIASPKALTPLAVSRAPLPPRRTQSGRNRCGRLDEILENISNYTD